MQAYPLYFGDRECGRVTVQTEGSSMLVRAVMAGNETAICRAVLVGERGERLLGVMEPTGRELTVVRRLYPRDVQALGKSVRGEVRVKECPWWPTDRPAALMTDPFLRRRLEPQHVAWWRREGARLCLALPMEDGKPFPLVCCFCLAQVKRVEGRRCAVFLFDENGQPLS